MEWNRDFRDLFFEFNAARVRYLVVGGYAVIFHTSPRFTKDIDLLIEPTSANARRALRALAAFGAPIDNLTVRDLVDPDLVYQIGVAPNRIDVLSKIKGVTFKTAWPKRVRARYAGQSIAILDAGSLHRAKLAAGRDQDRIDAGNLARIGRSTRRRRS
jgi:hypothetical protein